MNVDSTISVHDSGGYNLSFYAVRSWLDPMPSFRFVVMMQTVKTKKALKSGMSLIDFDIDAVVGHCLN